MTLRWILSAIMYVACWIYIGLATCRNQRYRLFWVGFLLPFLWIKGGLIAPIPARRRQGGRPTPHWRQLRTLEGS
jgi:hypothetical protein